MGILTRAVFQQRWLVLDEALCYFVVMLVHILLLTQLVATAMMTGILWLVQRVQYPLFLGLNDGHFSKWHDLHSSRITWIVAPMMIFELAVSAALVFLNEINFWQNISVLFLTCVIWGITFFISVPRHEKLSQNGFDKAVIISLIRTNWGRTLAYT